LSQSVIFKVFFYILFAMFRNFTQDIYM